MNAIARKLSALKETGPTLAPDPKQPVITPPTFGSKKFEQRLRMSGAFVLPDGAEFRATWMELANCWSATLTVEGEVTTETRSGVHGCINFLFGRWRESHQAESSALMGEPAAIVKRFTTKDTRPKTSRKREKFRYPDGAEIVAVYDQSQRLWRVMLTIGEYRRVNWQKSLPFALLVLGDQWRRWQRKIEHGRQVTAKED